MGWPVEPSWVAGGTIAPCRFVVPDPSADETILQCSVGGQPTIGVMQEGQKDTPGLTGSDAIVAAVLGDQNFKVHGLTDVCLIEAGGAFNAGAELMTDTNGRAVYATTGYYVGAIALQASAALYKKVLCQVVRYQKAGSGGSSGV